MILAEFLDVIDDYSIVTIIYRLPQTKETRRFITTAGLVSYPFVKARVKYIESDYRTGDYYIYLKDAIKVK